MRIKFFSTCRSDLHHRGRIHLPRCLPRYLPRRPPRRLPRRLPHCPPRCLRRRSVQPYRSASRTGLNRKNSSDERRERGDSVPSSVPHRRARTHCCAVAARVSGREDPWASHARTHTHTCTHTRASAHNFTHTHARERAQFHAHTRARARTISRTHTRASAHNFTHTHTRTHAGTHALSSVSAHSSICRKREISSRRRADMPASRTAGRTGLCAPEHPVSTR
jgi:hypothetical protein